jgi:hypothetical protein
MPPSVFNVATSNAATSSVACTHQQTSRIGLHELLPFTSSHFLESLYYSTTAYHEHSRICIITREQLPIASWLKSELKRRPAQAADPIIITPEPARLRVLLREPPPQYLETLTEAKTTRASLARSKNETRSSPQRGKIPNTGQNLSRRWMHDQNMHQFEAVCDLPPSFVTGIHAEY